MIPPEWTSHHRPDDRELLGWIRPEGGGYVPVSRLGRDLSGPVEWLDAEATLDAFGLGWLGQPWRLHRDGEQPIAVRIVEVTPERVRVKTEDYGAIDMPVIEYVPPFPAPDELRRD